VLAAATVAHLLLIFRFPLAPDETYYWDWSRHLDWGYYDQGPMVAWWIRASCLLVGDTPLGVRFGIVAATFGTQLFLALLARDHFGDRAALVSLLVASLTPLALAGSCIAT
jgi:4-amino-4-deoxy-L-arabinose transferase-like glycosyltransferase